MNKCGECTLCCKLLELHEIPSEIGVYCEKCIPCEGCTVHDNKPQECKDYQCMWTQMEHVSIDLRPDKCGIIFDRVASDVITARLEEGKMINDLLMGQINHFINEGFSVLIFRGREMKHFLNQNHTKNYVMEVVSDSAKLH